MTRELIFLPEVRRDFLEAFNYYKTLSPPRGGERFETAFNKALRQVKGGLITHRRAFVHFHRVFLPRYPYTVYYRLSENRAVIAALLYARFDPERIEAILKERKE